jgi:transcriptional regulator with GAF, ATPase, and Fis domain
MRGVAGKASAQDALSRITLEMTSRLELDEVLAAITRGLVEDLGLALARIWLLMPDRLCPVCVSRGRLGATPALHLVASAGLHTRTDGSYHRIPVGGLKIGAMATTREPLCSNDLLPDPRIPNKEWVREHGLRSFAGYPLLFREELLGVLGTFSAHEMEPSEFEWLGIFAHQAAIAIQNARLFAALERANLILRAENEYLHEESEEEGDLDGMVGRSREIRRVQKQIRQVAPTDAAVLVLGETGTGKAMVARAIHALGPRRGHALVRVNCAALTGEQADSELFGHARGAFAGAVQRRVGRFELADGGTLFLDEVGELPLDIQVKLLRVLQDREFERVGGGRPVRVDVRIVASTRRDLGAQVEEGTFREDLFYRLNVFPIVVPPLRERPGDIPALVDHFLAHNARQLRKRLVAVAPESMERLLRYSWPGNVRELQNVIERACIVAHSPLVEVHDPLREADAPAGPAATLAEVEREHILRVLSDTRGRIEGPRGAALVLGLHPNTLRSRMQRLGIQRPRPTP